MNNFYRQKKFALSILIILMDETHMTRSEPQWWIEVEFDLDIANYEDPRNKTSWKQDVMSRRGPEML